MVSTVQRKTRLVEWVRQVNAKGIWTSRRLKENGEYDHRQDSAPHVALGVNFIWQPSLGKMVAMILRRASEVVIGCRIQWGSLNLVALWSPYVFPVPHGSGVTDDKGNIRHGVFDTNAPVGSTSEDKVVSGMRMSGAVRI